MFKVGDRVRLIKTGLTPQKGMVGTVKELLNGLVGVDFDGEWPTLGLRSRYGRQHNAWRAYEQNFEHCPPAPSTPFELDLASYIDEEKKELGLV